eukprot:COSAG04_NODE_915_length_9438_cov_28.362351_10_plen_53_part_00
MAGVGRGAQVGAGPSSSRRNASHFLLLTSALATILKYSVHSTGDSSAMQRGA